MSTVSYKLTNPVKLLRAVAILAVALGFTFSSISGSVAGDQPTAELTYVTVQQGDSLWEMAAEYAPTEDPRDWIAEVAMLNALTSVDLTPGQQIALP